MRSWGRDVLPGLPPDTNNTQRGVEFGWRVHSAQESWTAKVDGKASLLLALQGGALLAIAVGHQKDGFLAKLTGWHLGVIVAASLCLVIGIVSTIAAVIPQLGNAKKHRAEYASHLVYFGHLRHWKPHELSAELAHVTGADELRMLGFQLQRMSEINWRKHQLLRIGLILTAAAIIASVGAVLAK
jgi:hypothetical protein